MEITIERARPGDAEVLASIQISSWLAAFADILDQDDLKKCTDRLSVTQMYEKLLERSIGYGYLLRIDQKPHAIAWWDRGSSPNQFACAELLCIHSLPDRWHQGYGSVLMERVLADMQAAGYRQVRLWVFEKNQRARAFYEKWGFVTDGRTKPGIRPIEIGYERCLHRTTSHSTSTYEDPIQKKCEED